MHSGHSEDNRSSRVTDRPATHTELHNVWKRLSIGTVDTEIPKNMAKEDFDIFWRTHMVTSSQNCQLPEEKVLYWTITKEETSSFPWTRREGTARSHATAAVARDLMTQVRVATRKNVMSVSMIQNYSPCHQCVEELLKTVALAQEKRVKFDICISFVALSQIRRPSWIWRGLADSIQGVTVNISNENARGLRLLHDAGVKVSTFNPDTWKFLYPFLGNGFPVSSGNHGKFFGGKYSNCESRFEEDKLMQMDLNQVLRGVFITSPSIGTSPEVLDLEWSKPSIPGVRVTEYRICVKKALIKNKEDDEKLWRVQQTLDKLGTSVKIPGELTYLKMTDLDPDSFYDVTVEALNRGMSVVTGRKICKTASKGASHALQTSTPNLRKMNSLTQSHIILENVASSQSVINDPTTHRVQTRLRRSNSGIGGGVRSPSNTELNSDVRASNGTSSLRRGNSLRSSFGRSTSSGSDVKRKTSVTERPIVSGASSVVSSDNSKGSKRKTSGVSDGSVGSAGEQV